VLKATASCGSRAAISASTRAGQLVEVQADGDAGSVYFASTLPASQADADRKLKERIKFENQTANPKVKGT